MAPKGCNEPPALLPGPNSGDPTSGDPPRAALGETQTAPLAYQKHFTSPASQGGHPDAQPEARRDASPCLRTPPRRRVTLLLLAREEPKRIARVMSLLPPQRRTCGPDCERDELQSQM